MDISWISTVPRVAQGGVWFGGDTYDLDARKALRRRFAVSTIVEERRVSDSAPRQAVNIISQLIRLRRLRTQGDATIRSFLPSVFSPFERDKFNIVLIHHIDTSVLPHRARENLFKMLFYRRIGRCDMMVAVSRYWRDHFISRGVRDVRVIYQGFPIDEFRFTGEEIEDFRNRFGLADRPIIYLGNCQRVKGVVEAYQALKDMDFHLVTSGRRDVNIPALNLNLEYRDYLRLLRASSVVLSMSGQLEGWCRSAHEAMLCATPVIGSGAGGMSELLEGGKQVVCTDFGELKDKVQEVMGNRKLGERGRRYARTFTISRFDRSWTDLLGEVEGLRTSGGPDRLRNNKMP
jgi:glycosyltransferase involved in cell wall biosynthesis